MSRGKRSGTWQTNIETSRITEFPIEKSYHLFFLGHRDLSSSSLVAIRPGRFGAKHIATAGALVAIGITMGILGDLQSEKAGDHCKDVGDFFLLAKGKASIMTAAKDFITEGLAIQEDNFGSDHQDFCALPIPSASQGDFT